jgi:phosphoglycolate phosphatase
MTVIVFDLDGTLSNPAEGLLAAINHALVKCGHPPREASTLHRFIGPSLDQIFADLLQTEDEEQLQIAIDAYRELYYTEGYKRDVVYDGIREMLAALTTDDYSLYVATAKRSDIASRVIGHFELSHHFKAVLGCGLKRKKHELLTEIREQQPGRHMVMIGDRSNDMLAAQAVDAECIGVLWGFGDEAELTAAGANALVSNPGDLLSLLKQGHASRQ